MEQGTFIFLLVTALGCILFQRLLRNSLTRDRYFYVRDLSLAAVMGLLALWSENTIIKGLVAASLGSLYFALWDSMMPHRGIKWLSFLPALAFALWGERINFLALPGGYMYFQGIGAVLLTTAWLMLFPMLFQTMDSIPGFAGHMLAVSLCLITFVTFFSGSGTSDALLLCYGSLALVGAFWSRLGHHFRQLGPGLCNLWGTLVAGVSLLGVSKVATLTSLLLVPLAFYALPLIEASLGLMNRAFTNRTTSRVPYLYARFLERGVDHPAAVRLLTGLCLCLGLMTALLRMHPQGWGNLPLVAAGFLTIFVVGGVVLRRKKIHNPPPKGFWGIPLDGISMNYALSKTLSWMKERGPLRQIVTLNALGMNDALSDKEFFNLLNRSDLNLPDGAGVVWAMKLLRLPVVERVSGVDFMGRLCRFCAAQGVSVYLFGAAPGVADRAAEELKRKNPDLAIAGISHGYLQGEEREAVAKAVAQSGAGVLFVALGMPAQEMWIDRHREEMLGVVAVGVGGSFDVYAGDLKRAPKIWSRLGMEWLYRLLQEPRRFKRDLGLAAFALKVLKTKLFGERGSR